jgi:hypothetical protein
VRGDVLAMMRSIHRDFEGLRSGSCQSQCRLCSGDLKGVSPLDFVPVEIFDATGVLFAAEVPLILLSILCRMVRLL